MIIFVSGQLGVTAIPSEKVFRIIGGTRSIEIWYDGGEYFEDYDPYVAYKKTSVETVKFSDEQEVRQAMRKFHAACARGDSVFVFKGALD